jgi:hypothetical protein
MQEYYLGSHRGSPLSERQIMIGRTPALLFMKVLLEAIMAVHRSVSFLLEHYRA